MAEFITKCSHCNAELQAQDELVGMGMRCPECQKTFTVKKNIPSIPETQFVQTNIQQSAEDTKNCPLCGGVINAKAVFCKHCKSNLNKTAVSETVADSYFIFICPECNTAAELPESMKEKEYECSCCCETSIAREALERDCPFCGEKIKIKATICKHCKQNVKPLLKKEITPLPAGKGSSSLIKLNSNNNLDGNLVQILWILSVLCGIIGIICCMCEVVAGPFLIAAALICSVFSLALKKNEKFELQEGEKILKTCRLRDTETIRYYTRITNQRLVLCAIEYPWIPIVIAGVIELFAKPKRITHAWKWEDIKKMEMSTSSEKKLGIPISVTRLKIEDETQTHIFCDDKGGREVLEFWNNQLWRI